MGHGVLGWDEKQNGILQIVVLNSRSHDLNSRSVVLRFVPMYVPSSLSFCCGVHTLAGVCIFRPCALEGGVGSQQVRCVRNGVSFMSELSQT